MLSFFSHDISNSPLFGPTGSTWKRDAAGINLRNGHHRCSEVCWCQVLHRRCRPPALSEFATSCWSSLGPPVRKPSEEPVGQRPRLTELAVLTFVAKKKCKQLQTKKQVISCCANKHLQTSFEFLWSRWCSLRFDMFWHNTLTTISRFSHQDSAAWLMCFAWEREGDSKGMPQSTNCWTISKEAAWNCKTSWGMEINLQIYKTNKGNNLFYWYTVTKKAILTASL